MELKTADNHDLELFIVDVLRHDIEGVASILNLLNDRGCIGWREFWPRDFSKADVIPALDQLLRKRMVKALKLHEMRYELVDVPENDDLDLQNLWHSYWFIPTEVGLEEWSKWQQPDELTHRTFL